MQCELSLSTLPFIICDRSGKGKAELRASGIYIYIRTEVQPRKKKKGGTRDVKKRKETLN